MTIRILDLSMGFAGPHVSAVLGQLGAEVVKVESCSHPDWWRGFAPPDRQPGDVSMEMSHVYNAANRNKRGITLELSHPRGREVLLRLVAVSDVVVENFTPRVMPSLGLSYEELAAVNPRVILVSLPAYGLEGPESEYVGYGMTMEAMSGLTALTGYEDGPPQMLSNAFGDPYSGTNGALAVLLALYERDRSGLGQHVEVAQLEAFVVQVAQPLLAYQESGEQPPRRGNARPDYAFQRVLRCAGEDEWVGVTCVSEEELSRLEAVTAGAGSIEAWCLARTPVEATEELLAQGVAAGPVHSAGSVLSDEQLVARGFWQPLEREHVGLHLHPAELPFLMEGVERDAGTPAPTLGQHSREVLRELAGVDGAEFDELVSLGVVGTEPLPVVTKAER